LHAGKFVALGVDEGFELSVLSFALGKFGLSDLGGHQ
jgi:hypothetical protein